MVYEWKPDVDSRLAVWDAQVVGEHLVELTKRNHGNLTSVIVLADAKNVESPIHNLFEWDNSKAAEQYRRYQAKSMAKSLILVRVDEQKKRVERTPFVTTVTISHSDGREHDAYVSTKQSRENPDYRRQVVERALAELARWIERWGDVQELTDLTLSVRQSWPEWDKKNTVKRLTSA